MFNNYELRDSRHWCACLFLGGFAGCVQSEGSLCSLGVSNDTGQIVQLAGIAATIGITFKTLLYIVCKTWVSTNEFATYQG